MRASKSLFRDAGFSQVETQMGSGALIRGRVKAAAGSKRTASQLHCMLSSDCVYQSENGLLDGSLGTIFV